MGGYIIFYLARGTNFFLSHLVPRRTPYARMSFIVIIEIVRRLICPSTLSVRLAANIIAGHMLISLISSPLISASILYLGVFFFFYSNSPCSSRTSGFYSSILRFWHFIILM